MNNDLNLVKVESVQALEAINRSEIDMQIATAKAYPRDVDAAMKQMLALATRRKETAEKCFYQLPRDGKTIEGISVRFAEIIATCWGNIRVQTRIIGDDGRNIITQGVCHDLQSNFAASIEVKRRITTKSGARYGDDMIQTTSMAASSIAFRNAILRVIPKAVVEDICEEVRNVAISNIAREDDLAETVNKMFGYFAGLGVSEEVMLKHLGIRDRGDITAQHIFDLRALDNALKEGATTIKEVFFADQADSSDMANKTREAAEKIQKAMGGQK